MDTTRSESAVQAPDVAPRTACVPASRSDPMGRPSKRLRVPPGYGTAKDVYVKEGGRHTGDKPAHQAVVQNQADARPRYEHRQPPLKLDGGRTRRPSSRRATAAGAPARDPRRSGEALVR